MECSAERTLFLGETSLRAAKSPARAYEFRASIAPHCKNTSVIDCWAETLLRKGYCELERGYHSAVFLKRPFSWSALLLGAESPVAFVSLRLRVNAEKGNKLLSLSTLNESAAAVGALVGDVHAVLARAAGAGPREGRGGDCRAEEGFQLYLAFTHFSATLFSTRYALGRSISAFVGAFQRGEGATFAALYQFIAETLAVVCRDYNVNNMDARWVFTYGFEVIETIVNQFVHARLLAAYLARHPLAPCAPAPGLPAAHVAAVEALADVWRLFALSVSMLDRLQLLDELFFTAEMARAALGADFLSAPFLAGEALRAAAGDAPVAAGFWMLRDFLAQTRLAHPAAAHVETLAPAFQGLSAG